MSIMIVKPGLLTTVQDLGRIGFLHQGVLASGAMDPLSLRVGNLLVGNPEDAAVLEMTLTGPVLEVKEDVLIAVTGGGMKPVVNDKDYPLGTPIFVPADSTIRFRSISNGCRAYLAVSGGIDVPVVLNSRSTYLRAGIGGYKGRALTDGDVLQVGKAVSSLKEKIEKLGGRSNYQSWTIPSWSMQTGKSDVIRIMKGAHFEQFTIASKKCMESEFFTVTLQSDRMGFRLKGNTPLELMQSFNLLSEAVAFGTIQVPPEGNPIVLMADRQTTGGYPRIAQVIAADLGKLSQLRPNDRFKFKIVTLEEAEEAYFLNERKLRDLRVGLQLKGL